jgi:hypothetical protein
MASQREVPPLLKSTSIERAIFGVRYQPRYEILDRVGSVMDRILRDPGTPFGPETFPYSNRDAGEHALINDKTHDSLRISSSDAILDIRVDTQTVGRLQGLSEQFSEHVLASLRDLARLRDIARYGMLLKLSECSDLLAESPVRHFLSRDFDEARSLSLRFTRRLPVEEALAKRAVDDYRNVIYTVKQNDDAQVFIWIDYQEYFNPQLTADEWRDRPFSRFVNRGLDYFLGEFQNWMLTLLRPAEVK